MKTTIIKTTIATAFYIVAAGASAYSIHGDSDSGFVLKCKDGTTNTSSMPPNHNTATAFCADHGGIAAGYPKAIKRLDKASPLLKMSPGTDHNASRSNRSSR